MKDMRKIRFVLLAFTVCTSFQFAHPTHATIERDGATWWSVEELLGVYKETEAEKIAECGDVQNGCYRNKHIDLISRRPEYRALERLVNAQLTATSINPAKEELKIIFFDRTNSSYLDGRRDNFKIERLYLGWFERWEQQIFKYDYESFLDGSVEGSHTVYYDNREKGSESLVAAEKEVSLPVSGSDLASNTSGVLGIKSLGSPFALTGSIDYSSCLNSPDYHEGMECKLYSSNKKTLTYFPSPGSLSRRSSEEPADRGGEQSSEESTGDTSRLVAEQSNERSLIEESTSTESSQEPPKENTMAKSEQNETVPKAPETGKSQISSNHDPGLIIWFISLMVIAVLLTIWWFIPTQAEKSRKKYKKSKKSIDKTRDLR